MLILEPFPPNEPRTHCAHEISVVSYDRATVCNYSR